MQTTSNNAYGLQHYPQLDVEHSLRQWTALITQQMARLSRQYPGVKRTPHMTVLTTVNKWLRAYRAGDASCDFRTYNRLITEMNTLLSETNTQFFKGAS